MTSKPINYHKNGCLIFLGLKAFWLFDELLWHNLFVYAFYNSIDDSNRYLEISAHLFYFCLQLCFSQGTIFPISHFCLRDVSLNFFTCNFMQRYKFAQLLPKQMLVGAGYHKLQDIYKLWPDTDFLASSGSLQYRLDISPGKYDGLCIWFLIAGRIWFVQNDVDFAVVTLNLGFLGFEILGHVQRW